MAIEQLNIDALDQIENLDLLDKNIDDIEDLPGFETPVNGEYILEMTVLLKKISDKTCVVTDYVMSQCVKQDNESEKPTPVGTKFSQMFPLEGDDKEKIGKAISALKAIMAPFSEHFGEPNMKATIVKAMEQASWTVGATVKRRKDREDPEKFWPSVSNVRLA